jgi:hypothetical protein
MAALIALIVLRRDKERADNYNPSSPIRQHKKESKNDAVELPVAPELVCGQTGERDESEVEEIARSVRSSSPSSVTKLEFKRTALCHTRPPNSNWRRSA